MIGTTFKKWKADTLGELDHFPDCKWHGRSVPVDACDCGDRHAFKAGEDSKEARVKAYKTVNLIFADFIKTHCEHLELTAEEAEKSKYYFQFSGHYYPLPELESE